MRRAALLLVFSISLLTSLGKATTLNLVSCSSPGAPFSTTPNACNALGFNGYAKSSVSSKVSLPSAAGDAVVIDALSTVSALQSSVRGISSTATATSSADISLLFDTTGPVRSGFLELDFNQLAWIAPVNGFMRESIDVAAYHLSPDGVSLQSVWLPIQLGTQFGFEYKQSIASVSSSLSGLTSGQIGSAISLFAFEADGRTRAQLFDLAGVTSAIPTTPEPASFGMTMLACLVGFAFMLRQQR